MTSILIAFPIDHASVLLADKLRLEAEISVTFYLDEKIDNEFQEHALQDLICVNPEFKSTKEKVCMHLTC